MPKLNLIENKKTVSSFDLTEGEILIGRDAQCHIHLEDEAISRRHVRIFTLMGDAFLEDMGSSNGTYVNGQLSKKCALNDGDVIQMGKKELRFSHPPEDDLTVRDNADVDATRIIRPGDFGPATKAVKRQQRSREGISPVKLSEHKTKEPKAKSKQKKGKKSGGFWGWIKGMFS
ncbi:MAG: FHA domain-containing protein [Gammaproteobacteria bacterium]|nr:FHA domain-containing protein [Gammaproteobacteria bacterium]